jgi:hypothetical protein
MSYLIIHSTKNQAMEFTRPQSKSPHPSNPTENETKKVGNERQGLKTVLLMQI